MATESTHPRTDGAAAKAPASPRLMLRRELRGLLLLYVVFGLLGLFLAAQCVSAPRGRAPAEGARR